MAAAAMAAAWLASACQQRVDSASSGVARVAVSCASACLDVARVAVTVSKGEGTPFQAFTVDLTGSGGQWTGRITGIPPGPGRAFDVVAYAADGGSLFTGSGRADIIAGATAVVLVVLHGPPSSGGQNNFPVIDFLSVSRDVVAPGASVQLTAGAHDPDRGDVISFYWRANCGTLANPRQAATRWTAPAQEGSCQVSLTVSDDKGAAVTASLAITVTTQLGGADVTVEIRPWPVVSALTGSILLGPTMQGDLFLEAASPIGEPLGYAWTSTCAGLVFDTDPPYTPTRPHFTLPGPSQACTVTVTVSTSWSAPAGTTASIGVPPNQGVSNLCTNRSCQTGQVCDPTDGQCKGPPGDPCTGVVCQAPDLCSVPGTCQPASGTCSVATPRTCPSGQSCDPADGLCKAADLCAGVVCQPVDQCHDPGQCLPATGQCSAGPAKSCPSGQCDPATGCVPAGGGRVPVPALAKVLPLTTNPFVALGPDGTAYLGGGFDALASIDGFNLTSQGGKDLAVASFDPGTRAARWAVSFGGGSAESNDPSGKAQVPTGIGVTADGTVVVGGWTDAGFSGNGVSLTPRGAQGFLVGLRAATGATRWARAFTLGVNAGLVSVAANPARNLVALCGYGDVAATDLVPGAVYGSGRDALVAVFDSAGNALWQMQLGSQSDEECSAVAIDDAGDVIVAGKYNNASTATTTATRLDPGGGQLPDPNAGAIGISASRRHLWVAKYAGASGAFIAQASFGSGNGNHAIRAVAADGSGNVVLAGSFNGTLPFGGTTLTPVAANNYDAFVARLTPALAASWAVQAGGSGVDQFNGVSVTSLGEVIAVGQFLSPTVAGSAVVGTLANAAATGASNDAILTKLSALGVPESSARYGDASTQAATSVAVNRLGAANTDLVEFTGLFAGTFDFAPGVSVSSAIVQSFLVFAPLTP